MTKRKAPKIVTISDRTWQGRQSWNRERIETMQLTATSPAHRLRFTVKSDSYDLQSYARVEVWSAEGWRVIACIPGPKMSTRASYVDPTVTSLAFNADIAELARIARGVLQ